MVEPVASIGTRASQEDISSHEGFAAFSNWTCRPTGGQRCDGTPGDSSGAGKTRR